MQVRLYSLLFALFTLLTVCACSNTKEDAEKEKQRQNSAPLTINIISSRNGVGLNRDIDILTGALTDLGHEVHFVDSRVQRPTPKVDLNIFVQDVGNYFIPFAEKNYLLPNPEWLYLSVSEISKYDLILCKTKETERIFKDLNFKTAFIGFTCLDCFDSSVEKNYKSPVHLVGASAQKGTEALMAAWSRHPEFPLLEIIRHRGDKTVPEASNIHLTYEYLSDSDLLASQNSHGLHLCPSITEGFGHYIVEGLSTEAVIVTTDAPPMNEFVSDKRCLVKYSWTEPWRYATGYYVDPSDLATVVANLLSLPESELKEIGKKNRQLFLENDKKFTENVGKIFNREYVFKRDEDKSETIFTAMHEKKKSSPVDLETGSTPENTEVYRCFLQKFLRDNKIGSVVDLGCGDWRFSKLVDWNGISYTGVDIVKDVVDTNNRCFAEKNINFIHGNSKFSAMPKADLLICKEVLQHLSDEEINKFLSRLDNYPHCLIVNDVDPNTLSWNNYNITTGGYHFLDLTGPPFSVPGKKILTYTAEGSTKQVLYIQNEQWEMTDYVWNLGMASTCDRGIEKNPRKLFATYSSTNQRDSFDDLQSGDVVWMRCTFVPRFQKEILPKIKKPIVLVICDGDESFPSECGEGMDVESLLDNPNIIHIFAQNCDYQGNSPKISHFPIGIDFHSVAYKGGYWGETGSPKEQEAALKDLLATLKPTNKRKPRAFVDFHLSDGMRIGHCQRYLKAGEDRTAIFLKLFPADVMDVASNRMKRSDLWKKKGEYAFSISPHGNGLDCHRTWEDLALGCIVIVKTSTLDPLYEGLPVVIVQDWNEVTKENMAVWLKKYGDASTNPSYREKLTNAYWLNKIQAIVQ